MGRIATTFLGAALLLFGLPACAGSETPPPTTRSSTTVETPTSQATVAASLLPDGGLIAPGTYTTAFQPTMTLTATSAGWEVDVDARGWVGMEFPLPDHVLGTLNIIGVNKVFDPTDGGRPIDPPGDLADLIAELPGLKVINPPTPVEIGGAEGTQLDVLVGPENVQLGPIPGVRDVHNGFGERQMVRIIVVSVDDRYVQIAFAPDEAGAKHFDDAVDFSQPLIDSITWN